MIKFDPKNVSMVGLTNEVEARPSTTTQSQTTQPQTGRKIILVIDDNVVFQKAMLMKLRSRGYDVMTAEDGSAASAAMRRLKPDLILLDIVMPQNGRNGGFADPMAQLEQLATDPGVSPAHVLPR